VANFPASLPFTGSLTHLDFFPSLEPAVAEDPQLEREKRLAPRLPLEKKQSGVIGQLLLVTLQGALK